MPRLAAVLLAFWLPHAVAAQGCWPGPPRSLRVEAADATLVVYGRLTNPRRGPGDGTTDIVIEQVLKPGGGFRVGDVVKYARFVAVDNPMAPPRAVFFIDLSLGAADVYRGVQGPAALRDYAARVLAIDPRDKVELLQFCADHLGHANREVAGDAYKEFQLADAADIRRATRQMRPARLRRLLREGRAEGYTVGLIAYLLGNCGEDQDAVLLRRTLDHTLVKGSFGLDGVLVGYTLLRPRAGLARLRAIAGEPDNPFLARYAALRAVRTLRDDHPGVVTKKELLGVVGRLLGQDDIADLIIEDLRKWRCWRFTDQILGMFGQKKYDIPIVQRSILRYALRCPDPQAMKVVDRVRQRDPDRVKETEELLQLETVER